MTKAKATANDELPIGRISGLFGINGELKCDPTAAGRALFIPGARLRCEVGGHRIRVTIVTVREHKNRLLIALEEAQDANSAERFVRATFFAPRNALEVGPGEYLDIDLVGCAVVGLDGVVYGKVHRVEHFPSSDMLVVGSRLLPMVGAFINRIDIEKQEIVVNDLPKGLLDGEPLA